MTLCLSWKQGQNIFFASDSRLTNGDLFLTDNANKVFKIKVKLYNSLTKGSSGADYKAEYQTTYGLCFTGSYLNGSIVSDTIEDFLSNILISEYSDISIDNLSNIAFAIYKQVSRQFIESGNNILSEVLFGGYCLKTNNFKLYKFPKPKQLGNDWEFVKEEMNVDNQTIFIGEETAKLQAAELHKKISTDYSHYHILREVILDTNIKSVGGNIQIGHFHPETKEFTTHGIEEYLPYIDNNGLNQYKTIYKLRGLIFDLEDTEIISGKVGFRKPFFCPFTKDKDELIQQQGKKA